VPDQGTWEGPRAATARQRSTLFVPSSPVICCVTQKHRAETRYDAFHCRNYGAPVHEWTGLYDFLDWNAVSKSVPNRARLWWHSAQHAGFRPPSESPFHLGLVLPGTRLRHGSLPTPMEAFLHRLLDMRSDFPIWLRYILTLGLVGIAFFARLLLEDRLGAYPFLLFIPAILLASVIFDRGSGILATAAGAALAAGYLMRGPASSEAIPLALFMVTGLCIAAVTELLRTTLRNLAEAKRFTEVLLQELAHRTRNDLATIVSIL